GAYYNSQCHSETDTPTRSTTAEVSCHVVRHDPCAARSRQLPQPESLLRLFSTHHRAAAPSFSPKGGKEPFGLGPFFNGCASRAERGLEISTLAVVDVTRRCAFT